MKTEREPDCVRRLRDMTSEEGFDDYSTDEVVNTAREVIAVLDHADLALDGTLVPPPDGGFVRAVWETAQIAADFRRDLDEARAILNGRTTPPTLAEIAAHPGEWLVEGCVVGFYFYDDHDQHLRLCAGDITLSDRAARAWLAESAAECRRWIALDNDNRPTTWPVVTP